MTTEAVLPRSLTVLPEWSPHWCVTPGCQHMPAMGHDYCCCCEDTSDENPADKIRRAREAREMGRKLREGKPKSFRTWGPR